MFDEAGRTSLFVTSEVEEAIFLADRLIILTNRPTRVKKVMDVDLPRPRSYHMLASPRYLALKEEALAALHARLRPPIPRHPGPRSGVLW